MGYVPQISIAPSGLLVNGARTPGDIPVVQSDESVEFEAPSPAPTFPLAPNLGGLGIANNPASTTTIDGAHSVTWILSGTTILTLPTSGTLATTSQIPGVPTLEQVLGQGNNAGLIGIINLPSIANTGDGQSISIGTGGGSLIIDASGQISNGAGSFLVSVDGIVTASSLVIAAGHTLTWADGVQFVSNGANSLSLTTTLFTVDANFAVTGTTSLDNGAITTDGSGNINAPSITGTASSITSNGTLNQVWTQTAVTPTPTQGWTTVSGGGSPGGSSGQIQYNNASAFGGFSGATIVGGKLVINAGTWSGDDLTPSQVGLGSVADALQLTVTNDLSDLANTATARTNLGLGSAATQASSAFDAAGSAATAQSNAETYASNGSNISSGTVAAGRVAILNQNTTGSAATLTTPRAINGVNFDGSASITVPAAASTLTGSTLATGVTASSLTSFGASIVLGTPASGTLTNCTIPASAVTGTTNATITTLSSLSLPESQVTGLSTTYLALAGGTMSASIAMGSNAITGLANGVNPQDAVTVSQLQTATAALVTKADCQCATTTALPTATYSNGSSGVGATLTMTAAAVLVIDGYTPALNDRILVQDQASAFQNGLFALTTVGTLTVPAVLTRTSDLDTPAEVGGATTFIINGSANGGLRFQCLVSGTVTIGTTAINWSQFLGQTYSADGTTLTLTGTTFSVKSSYNAPTATLAGNVTATTNSTLATLSALTGFIATANGVSATYSSGVATVTFGSIAPTNVAATAVITSGVTTATVSASSYTINAALGCEWRLLLQNNITLNTPSSPSDGQGIAIWFTQDGTGSRTLTLNSSWIVPTALSPITLSTAAGTVDLLTAIYVASISAWRVVGFITGYAS